MPPQPQQNDMSPEDAKATMGIATHLQSFLLPPKQGQPQQSQEPQKDPRVDKLEQQFGDLKKQVGATIKEEIGGIKDLIKQALQDDNQKEAQ